MRALLGRFRRTVNRSISEQLATLTSSGDGSATAATTNVQPASVIVDAVGSQLIAIQFKATGTTPKLGAFWETI
jgi:hypothetical protein